MNSKILVIPHTKNTEENLNRFIFGNLGHYVPSSYSEWVTPKRGKVETGMPVIVISNKTGEVLLEASIVSIKESENDLTRLVRRKLDGNFDDRKIITMRKVVQRYKNASDYLAGAPFVQGCCVRNASTAFKAEGEATFLTTAQVRS